MIYTIYTRYIPLHFLYKMRGVQVIYKMLHGSPFRGELTLDFTCDLIWLQPVAKT